MTRRLSPVIVAGTGLAGLRTAEQLRAHGYRGAIVMVGDESHLPYNRPPLSKDALRGPIEHARLAFRHRLADADVVWRLGSVVQSADLTRRTVTLASDETISYAWLVAATGVSARRLPLTAALERRYVVRTIDDAIRLRRVLVEGARVVVVGAGFIGCEVAATANQLGCVVDVVDPLEVPMSRPLAQLVGAELQRRHEERGVRFHLGLSVAAIGNDVSGRAALQLSDGSELIADVVVEAVGSTPNVAWLEGNGLDLADGVRTDGLLRPVTGDGLPAENAVVVGDIARFPNALYDDVPRRVEHWNIAAETAKRAACTCVLECGGTAAGQDHDQRALPFASVPAFWSDQFDVRVQSFGMPSLGQRDARVLEGNLSSEFAVGYYDDGALVGVVLIGLLKRHAFYRRRILARQQEAAAERSSVDEVTRAGAVEHISAASGGTHDSNQPAGDL